MDNLEPITRSQRPAWLKSLALITTIALLAACGVTDRVGKRVDDTWAGDMLFSDNEKLILTSDGGNNLNIDDTGEPLSVVLRVYQLGALERFTSIDSDSLWAAPEKALGNTLIESNEITLLPGMGQVNQWPLNKATRYVGVAAFFHTEEMGNWKVAFDAESIRKDGIWFSSDGLRVLVDSNYMVATQGNDVMDKTATQEQTAQSAPPSDQPEEKTLQQKLQDKGMQQAEDTLSNSAQKAADSQFNSLLKGAQ